MGISFDFSELDQLAADLGAVADDAGPNIQKAVTVTALKVKKSWQEPLKGSATLPALPYALSYDVEVNSGATKSTVEAEIGFDLAKNQGPLGGVSEYGTPTITGRGYGIKALEQNEDDFEKGLDIALRQAERENNL